MAGKYRRKPVGRKPPAKGRRKFVRKKKTRFVPRKPIARGVECYQVRLAEQSATLSQNAGSALLGPKNSEIIFDAWRHASHTITDSSGAPYVIDGNWVKCVYSSVNKFRVSFDDISFHADNQAGLNLRCHQGVMMITPAKFSASLSTQVDWVAAIEVELRKQLYNSDMCSDFLDYAQKNRNIKITKTFNVRPNRNHMIRVDEEIGTTHMKQFNSPPPVTFTVNHSVPKMKTRMGYTSDTNPVPVPENLWVPFTCFTCEQLTSNSGHFNISYSSRSYFTDV
jgi:hypothetical protein